MKGWDVCGAMRRMAESPSALKAVVALAVLGSASCVRQDAAEPVPHVSTGFGQRQLAQMLDDRPDMKEVVPQSHPVRQWLAEGFDGVRDGLRVHWCGNLPGGGRAAEYFPALPPYPEIICVSPGTEITPIDRWAAVVYAMVSQECDWDAIAYDAGNGLLDADELAEECAILEFAALKRTQKFFLEWPLPQSSHHRDRWYNWIVTGLGTYEEYKSASNSPRGMNYVDTLDKYRSLFQEKTR